MFEFIWNCLYAPEDPEDEWGQFVDLDEDPFLSFCLNHEFCLKIFQIFRKLIVFGQNEHL